jgi:hypothetical protein
MNMFLKNLLDKVNVLVLGLLKKEVKMMDNNM